METKRQITENDVRRNAQEESEDKRKAMEEAVIVVDDEPERGVVQEEEEDGTNKVEQAEVEILESDNDSKGKDQTDQEESEDKMKTMGEVVIDVDDEVERNTSGDEEEEKRTSPFFEGIAAGINIVQTILLAVVTVIANVAPDLELPGLFWEGHNLSDVAIVQKIYLLNLTFLVVLLTGFLHIFFLCVEYKERIRLYRFVKTFTE